ncbi:Protein of unknown function (DUF1469) [Snodgrassella alvi SCGC AB-598-O11]|nr:Protein of unknown function (DUF1469) [Snodgrassella alvi SCGC AB-598-O11]
MNDRSEYLKIMQEWSCCSRLYAFHELFFVGTGAYICFIFLLNILLFKGQLLDILIKDQVISTLIILLAAICTLFGWKRFKTKRKNFKQVYFTPKAIYIEDKKIDIFYLKSITFIDHIKSFRRSGTYFKFCIRFTENRIIKEDIYFYMKFGKPYHDSYEHYDFEDFFITILETLAKERREILKDYGKAI